MSINLKKLVIFDGLPGSGKTTLVNWLGNEYHGLVIPEVSEHNLTKPYTEEYFIKCEELKINKFNNSEYEYNFMDRSPISIMAHNYGRLVLGYENVYNELSDWYKNQNTRLNLQNTLYIYPRISKVKLCNIRKWGEHLEKLPKDIKEIQGVKLWTDEKFLEIVKGFYDNFYNSIDNKFIIDCDMLPLEEVFELIKIKINALTGV